MLYQGEREGGGEGQKGERERQRGERQRDRDRQKTERQTRNTHHHLHSTNEHVQTTRLQHTYPSCTHAGFLEIREREREYKQLSKFET